MGPFEPKNSRQISELQNTFKDHYLRDIYPEDL